MSTIAKQKTMNKGLVATIFYFVVLLIALGCGGHSGSNETSSLRVTVLEDRTELPISDATIVLHGAGGVSVDHSIQTTSNGEGVFSDIGRARATVTVAKEAQCSDGNRTWTQRLLVTVVDAEVNDWVVHLGGGGEQCSVPSPEVSLGFPNGYPESGSISVSPMGHTRNVALYDPPLVEKVYPRHIQNDGTLSIVALAGTSGPGDSDWSAEGYGFTLDQIFSGGDEIDILLDREPKTIDWVASRHVRVIEVTGVRKEVEFLLGACWLATQSVAGKCSVAADFPAEWFKVAAYTHDDVSGTGYLTYAIEDNFLDAIQIHSPNISINDFVYDENNRIFRWDFLGEDDPDITYLTFSEHNDQTTTYTSWIVLISSEKTFWNVVELPHKISNWVDPTTLSITAGGPRLSLAKMETMTGFDQSWILLLEDILQSPAHLLVNWEAGKSFD